MNRILWALSLLIVMIGVFTAGTYYPAVVNGGPTLSEWKYDNLQECIDITRYEDDTLTCEVRIYAEDDKVYVESSGYIVNTTTI